MFQVQIINQYGTFKSKNIEDERRTVVVKLLEKIGDMDYFSFHTESGEVYFPKGIMQNSVVLIVDL